MAKNIFLFNGPPGCGKDAACKVIQRLNSETIYAYFKEWLYEESSKVLDLTFEAWSKICQDIELKDLPMFRDVDGSTITPRGMLIHLAESVLKPKHGRDCIAIKMAERLQQQVKGLDHYTVVVPDLGFPEELITLQKYFPDANIVLVHIYRPNCTYVGDSRNYIGSPDATITNKGSLVEFQIDVTNLYRETIGLYN